MIRLGRSLTPDTQASPSGGVAFTYWESVTESPVEPTSSSVLSVLEQQFPEELKLSTKAMLTTMRRSMLSGNPLPTLLARVLAYLLPAESVARLQNEIASLTQTSSSNQATFAGLE